MKIYVGNLPYTVDDDRLRVVFGAFGEPASAAVVVDRANGRSKGYGFVEMSDDDARKAILGLNRTQLDGRTIWVNEARAKA
jgi:RNA recognition motif-containing protein